MHMTKYVLTNRLLLDPKYQFCFLSMTWLLMKYPDYRGTVQFVINNHADWVEIRCSDFFKGTEFEVHYYNPHLHCYETYVPDEDGGYYTRIFYSLKYEEFKALLQLKGELKGGALGVPGGAGFPFADYNEPIPTNLGNNENKTDDIRESINDNKEDDTDMHGSSQGTNVDFFSEEQVHFFLQY